MVGRLREIAGPLGNRKFLLLWIGRSMSLLGDGILPVALTLAIIKGTGSAADLGLVLAAEAVPQLVLLLVGGVWADRLPRRWVMFSADVLNLAAQTAMGTELLVSGVHIPHLMIFAACAGTANAFFWPASDAIVPATVATTQLPSANALLGLSKQIGIVLGPAIATTLAVTVGAGWAMLANAVTYAISLGTLALLRVAHVPAERAGFWTELRQGWRELWRHTWYWTNLIAHSCWNLARSAYQTLGPLVAVTMLGGQVSWGMIAQGAAVGGLIGAFVALRIRPRRPLVVGNLALALGCVPPALLAVPVTAPVIAVAAGFMYGGLTVLNALWQTTVQQRIPAQSLSRVMSYDWLVSLGLTPLGQALAGPIAAGVGTRTTLIGAAVLVGVSCLGMLALPAVWQLSGTPREPQLTES
ncbi:MFS transporter [Sciscionella sediminilitoris]|uniref:MFS transporter n=1 Tax=Sciscionella sediminilitoris TaxID=1445613 RepID=UPI000689DB32|nr:MFS transporter [Sciscionella sp. SE31]